MACRDFKELNRRTAAEKVLHDKALLKIQNLMVITGCPQSHNSKFQHFTCNYGIYPSFLDFENDIFSNVDQEKVP